MAIARCRLAPGPTPGSSAFSPLLILMLIGGDLAAQEERIAKAIARLDTEHVDARVLEQLIDAGARAVRPLLSQLNDVYEDPGSAKFANVLRVLRAMGPDAGPACPQLAAFLSDARLSRTVRNEEFLSDVAGTLARIVVFAPEHASETRRTILGSVPENDAVLLAGRLGWPAIRLLHRLHVIGSPPDDGEISARMDAADPLERELAIELMPFNDRSRVPCLLEILDDPDQPTTARIHEGPSGIKTMAPENARTIVWSAAAMAVARMAPNEPHAIHGLVLLIGAADDPRERVRAAVDLGVHGAAASCAITALVAATESVDDRLVAEAVTALGMIGVATPHVIDRLRLLMRSGAANIARRAEAALKSLE